MIVIDMNKLKRASYISKRMCIIKNICKSRDVDIEYLFGLFNLYNIKNKGRWFWQKTSFTGILKEAFDKFNSDVDVIIKELRSEDEQYILKKIKVTGNTLDNLLTKMELNLDVDRERDKSYVEGHLDNNLKILITDGLKGFE